MKTISSILTVLAIAVTPAACAHGPTSTLVEARQEYAQAAEGPAKEYAPVDLYEAEKALQRAERAYEKDPGSTRERDLAYVAVRRVQLAETRAAMRKAQQDEQEAEAARVATLQQQRDRSLQQLAETKDQLDDRERALQDREHALRQTQRERDRFQRRLTAATSTLEGMATIEQDLDRTVVILNDEVLFEKNSAKLIDLAKDSLRELSAALKELDGTPSIVIEGYTDSTGSKSHNQRLSQERANAVRQFLVQEGVPPEVVSAIGFGETNPVASNSTPEGRANNRRVEIVIEDQFDGKSVVGRGERR